MITGRYAAENLQLLSIPQPPSRKPSDPARTPNYREQRIEIMYRYYG